MTIQPTTLERTNTQIENLRDRIIKLCEKMYDLKKLNEDESKINQTLVNDMCDYPDYIELYKRHPKFSTQYLKNINAVIKLTNTKEEFYEYITDNQYGIYKLLYILSKIDTVSTKKSYVCAVKHLMVQVIPNSQANCKVLGSERVSNLPTICLFSCSSKKVSSLPTAIILFFHGRADQIRVRR